MPLDYEVLSVDVHVEANRIPWAEICFLDGDAALRKFRISESGDFDLGVEVELTIGYVNQPDTHAPVFKGIVTRHAVEFDHRGFLLRVELRHAAHLMTQQRKSAAFAKQNDAAVIGALSKPYKAHFNVALGMLTGSMHPELVQYHASDWDFMMSRCQANGWIVVMDGANLKILAEPYASGPTHPNNVLDYNALEIFAIELALDGSEQYESATAQGYDYATLTAAAAVVAKGTTLNPGTAKPGALKSLSAGQTQTLFSGTVLSPDELKAWAGGTISRSRLAFFRGRMELMGDAKIQAGKPCEIKGIGSKFDGKSFIAGVRHRLTVAGWSTDVQIGMPATAYGAQGKPIVDALAAGLVPGVNGLQIGVVQAFEQDAGGQHRVRVYLPAMGKKENLIWARMCMPTAGKGAAGSRGMLFWPEEGDEVIVGFLNDDPRAAVVMGSLFNNTNAPLFPRDGKDQKKGLITKGGSKLVFDDQEEDILIATKEQFEVQINEKKKTFRIQHMKGKALFTLDEKGILLQFGDQQLKMDEKGIEMLAAGHKLNMNGDGVLLKSGGKMNFGSTEFALDGGSKVEIKGGSVELK